MNSIYPGYALRCIRKTIKAADSALSRGLASPTAFDFVSRTDDHVPFENALQQDSRQVFQFPWMPSESPATTREFDTDPPLIINDSLTTRAPKFRSVDAISGEVSDLISTTKACVHVGRYERAATLMQRLNTIYKTDAPALLSAHNEYIRELSWKITSTRDQQLLRDVQSWFEVDMRGQGIIPNALTYALLIQVSLQDVSGSKSNRSLRRYLHLAEEAGLKNAVNNAMITVLNEQDLGRVTRLGTPEPLPIQPESISRPEDAPSVAPKLTTELELPGVRPVDSKLAGLKALRHSLSLFSDPMASTNPTEGAGDENSDSQDLERQLRIEQDTFESAIERWRADNEQLKRIGINSSLKDHAIGALMWDWLQVLEPAIEKEIELAKEAEGKILKKAEDEDRCHYGPFLQYLPPKKLSAVTILTCLASFGATRTGDSGTPITHMVMKIANAIQNESMISFYSRRNGRDHPSRKTPDSSGTYGPGARPKQRLGASKDSPGSKLATDLSSRTFDAREWSTAIKVRIGAVLLSKLLESAKVLVRRKHPQTGEFVEETQPAFLHQYRYNAGRRVGMLSMNSAMHERVSNEPLAATLTQHFLPMVVKPKPWAGFRDGGFLTGNEPMVRLHQADEQGRRYCSVAVANDDMTQVASGLDVLAKTPWKINAPVLEVMLEVWNSGEGIGEIAPYNPDLELPPEPIGEDKAERARYISELKRIGNLKAGLRSQRCYQNFQLEIARAYLNETFYFPHNTDFRGRAYPMSPLLSYMGSDLPRGMLLFGIGKELGPSGLRWLKIHLANLYGYDKASFEERVVFVESHLSDISDSATQPLKGSRWWLGAEDPWQCLATCKELHNALTSPDPQRYVTNLAIHQDGTCNGLQHYAALGGDSMGARQVNLEPGDRPSDIYTGIAEIVKQDIHNEAMQGSEVAKVLEGKVSRKVVKQTVMTNVYGVTFMGAKLQIMKQLKELYPNSFLWTDAVNRGVAASYIAKKTFKALANLFNGAHDIQYWLGDCAGRIATAVTPEQMQRIEAATAGTLDEQTEYRRTPLKRKTDRGHKDVLLSFKQSVIWTSPLRMPVVQPYRQQSSHVIETKLQRITVSNPSLADPVDKRKQLSAFPPNFIHSLDATHMILSALECEKQGLTFAAVHDSFWTHPGDVDTMNGILRDMFIKMHSEDIIGRLRAEFALRYRGCMYATSVKGKSKVGRKIRKWRTKANSHLSPRPSKKQTMINELLQERRRLKLLASDKAEERKEGEDMVTAYSIFEASAGEDALADEQALSDVLLGQTSPARENKLQADEQLAIGDEDNIDPSDTFPQQDVPVQNPIDDKTISTESMATKVVEVDDEQRSKTEASSAQTKQQGSEAKIWFWRPLTFPPVPKRGDFDVSRIGKSQYFFS
ncbi:MAG: hypothetical protein Q9174_002310 [Haloplaca sp. 1 TL-2023]